MGVFIQITVHPERLSSEISHQLVQLCPVDIFELKDGRVSVKGEEEDECTLCRLCLEAAPRGAVTIYKTYCDQRLASMGT